MSPRAFAGRGVSAALLAFTSLTVFPAAARRGLAEEAQSGLFNARLTRPADRFAVARAIEGAARQLEHVECQGLLDEFSDASGRSLRTALKLRGGDVREYLFRVFFYDAPEAACRTSNLAVTTPGSRAVFVCGTRFVRAMQGNSRHAEAILIHELLHSLGLGENPPSSDQISERVRARCGGKGPISGGQTRVARRN